MATVVDSYSESNRNSDYNLNSEAWAKQYAGQTFTGDGGTLNSVKFYLKRGGTLTGNARVEIYAHTGTYGTNGVPTGAVLATSGNVAGSGISTAASELITFDFTGVNKITLTNATKYCVAIYYNTDTGTSFLFVGIDTTTPSHAGNAIYNTSSTWTAVSGTDTCFYVYKDDTTSIRDVISAGIISFPR